MVGAARTLSVSFGERSEVDALDGEMVLVGGFRITDESRGDGELGRGLDDSYREAGWAIGHTFPGMEARSGPTPFHLIRIDHVIHSGGMRARRSYVGNRGGPDLRFLVAELSF